MDGTRSVDDARLRSEIEEDLKRCLEKVVSGVNAAAAGRLLADSEEIARDALREFSQVVYQKALQQKIDAAEAAFSPSGEPRDRKTL